MSRLAAILGLCLAAGGVWVGTARGDHSDSVCSTCHVPHMALRSTDGKAVGPLWNPLFAAGPLPTFTLYSSSTFDALATGITQPDGSSKLCLGCHDGAYFAISAAHTFGDDKAITLTESHPISFVYDTALANNPRLHVAGALNDPSTALSGVTPSGTIAADLLDSDGKLQCGSCHNVHHGGIGPSFLRFNYTADNGKAMCRTCHRK